jgi:uncharacterized protein (DUF433 family)
MSGEMVGTSLQAIENIHRYQAELRTEPQLAKRMKQVHVWYAVTSDEGTWIFAPSKFVGYAKNTARDHLVSAESRDGGRTEDVLKSWFELVPPGTRRAAEVSDALREFLRSFGHSEPRRNARICIPRQDSGHAGNLDVQERIHVDAAICGGRPHIRGTRVRVSDILDMLANGVSQSEILADYPYLNEVDLRAALAFGAAASAHRIISAA